MVRGTDGRFYFLDAAGLMRFAPSTDTLTAGGAIPTYGALSVAATPLVVASDGRIYFGLTTTASSAGRLRFDRPSG